MEESLSIPVSLQREQSEYLEEIKVSDEKKFRLVSGSDSVVECVLGDGEIVFGGRLNRGREELRDDGHIYAIRDFGKFKAGDRIV